MSTEISETSTILIQDHNHPEFEVIRQIEEAILDAAGGEVKLRREISNLIRQAIDEVIDAARSKRFTLSEIEKTEKTYLGTKVEILLRNYLGFPKGRVLDLSVNGIEVDIKNTMKSGWMIPREAMNRPCILIKEDETRALFSFGLVVIRKEILRRGSNQDAKGSISSEGLARVHWMFRSEPYPKSFWVGLAPEIRRAITTPRGGTERLVSLFRLVQERPISRQVIEAIAQQYDPMKRVRKNGGARDILEAEGIAILWGGNDKELIAQFSLPVCARNEFISFKPTEPDHIDLLRHSGRIK